MTRNVGSPELPVNRNVLMHLVEVKVGGVMEVKKEISTQQMVSQQLAPLHVGFSASLKHSTRVRTQIDCLRAAGFFFSRSLGALQFAVER